MGKRGFENLSGKEKPEQSQGSQEAQETPKGHDANTSRWSDLKDSTIKKLDKLLGLDDEMQADTQLTGITKASGDAYARAVTDLKDQYQKLREDSGSALPPEIEGKITELEDAQLKELLKLHTSQIQEIEEAIANSGTEAESSLAKEKRSRLVHVMDSLADVEPHRAFTILDQKFTAMLSEHGEAWKGIAAKHQEAIDQLKPPSYDDAVGHADKPAKNSFDDPEKTADSKPPVKG
ncbi:hypothetical protein KSF_081630 [Reticulibacter mediterranei]|uniref:Uncharacterized protein n=1 Tax=Reticulibacter mediterranei TaxID=2778369 RepID=A0A8J3IWI2_9CHLR|nr:hypothetical protein [Reticulibacter mediterranei]GHO98115.1 hypothetical protein KSF_081630 [Reticulibacter mediterranei]